jgi:prevent-host-death family protein
MIPGLASKDVTNMSVNIMPISDLRRKAASVIDAVQRSGDVVYITQYGRPVVVMVDYERYEQLVAQLEDLSDMASLEAAAGEAARPYADFLAEMGLAPEVEPASDTG